MNIVQIGEKLRDQPISILRSEDILIIMNKINDIVPEEQQISATSTGNDIYKLFTTVTGEVQTVMLEDIFNSRRESIILNSIIEEASKQTRKDVAATKKWGSVQGSLVLFGAVILLVVGWSFLASYGQKPPVPDAVVGNLVTELLRAAVDLLLQSVTPTS